MKVYKFKLLREVSRVVELTQTAHVYIKADDDETALRAVKHLCDVRDAEEHCTEWEEVPHTRSASDDDVVKHPHLDPYEAPRSYHGGYDLALDAREVLGLDDEPIDDDQNEPL